MRFRSIATAVFFLFAFAACTGDAEEATPATTPTSAPESTSTTAQLQTSTTQPAPTSTTEPESTEATTTALAVSDEEAVAAVHTRWMTEANAVDELEPGDLDRYLTVAREVTTGSLLARLEERPQRIEAGAELIVSPGYSSNIVHIEVQGDTASVLDCSRDQSEGYSAAGELTTAADDFFKIRSSRLVRINDAWFVEEFFTGGDDRCEPDDS